MKSIKKIVVALSLGILCVGCNNNKVVKITINSGVGSFADKSTITTLLVEPGSKLSECHFTAPSISIYRIEDFESEQEIPVLNYLTEDNKVYEDTPITSDTVLYANYYESLDQEKEISRNTITETYEKITDKTEILTDKYNEAISEIDEATTPYELFFLVNDYHRCLETIPLIDDSEGGLSLLIDLNDMILSRARQVKEDQRIMSYIDPVIGLFNMSVLRHTQEFLIYSRQAFNIINKYIERNNPNISYVYGKPFEMFIRANAQQSILVVLITSLHTYAEACTHCDTTPKVLGLGDPLIKIAAAGVLRPDFVSMFMDIYEDFVEYLLNS